MKTDRCGGEKVGSEKVEAAGLPTVSRSDIQARTQSLPGGIFMDDLQ